MSLINNCFFALLLQFCMDSFLFESLSIIAASHKEININHMVKSAALEPESKTWWIFWNIGDTTLKHDKMGPINKHCPDVIVEELWPNKQSSSIFGS